MRHFPIAPSLALIFSLALFSFPAAGADATDSMPSPAAADKACTVGAAGTYILPVLAPRTLAPSEVTISIGKTVRVQ